MLCFKVLGVRTLTDFFFSDLNFLNCKVMASISKDGEPSPIEIDSNAEEVDSKNAKKATTLRTGTYKSAACGKTYKRQRKLTSTVRENYTFLEPDKEGNLWCKCKKCGQVYSGDSKYGTGNLKRHTINCKRKNVRDIGQLLLQSRSGSLSSRRPEFDIEMFRELLALCVVKHDLPFQFAEYDGVRNIFVYLNSDVKMLSRHTTRNDVLKMFKREKERMKDFFHYIPGRVAFTSDCWTSINTDGYISLTAHYIDESWSLQKRILNFSFMPPPHNGVSLAEKILLLMKDWVLIRK